MIGNISFNGNIRLDTTAASSPRSLDDLKDISGLLSDNTSSFKFDVLDLSKEYKSIAVTEEKSPLEKTGNGTLSVRMNGADLYELLSGRSANNADGTRKQVISSADPEYGKLNVFERQFFIDKTSVSAMFMNTPEVGMMIMSWGMKGDSDSKIAEHIGNIGKRLDNAYAEGKFTKREYETLCKGLDEYAVDLTNKTKRVEISSGLIRERYESGGFNPYNGLSGDALIADRNAKADSYFEKNPVDMTEIFRMINAVRYGTAPISAK